MYTQGEIRVEQPAPDTAVAVFVGDHDLAGREDTRALLESLIEDNTLVVADLSDTTFVDSATIHLLLVADTAARVRGRTFRVQTGSADIVLRALELSGLPKRLECVPSRQEATRSGRASAA